MGFCLPVLLRILGPKRFIEQFLASFTWRGSFNTVGQDRCEEYRTAYETYSVHHKYYTDESTGSTKEKAEALQTSLSPHVEGALGMGHLRALSEIILLFAEEEIGEAVYLFSIWKDNLLIPAEWSPDKVGPAWNIKTIFQRILRENAGLQHSLKYGKNFRLSLNIIEGYDRIYNTMDEKKFYRFIRSKSDELSDDDMRMAEPGWNTHALPIWDTAYPRIMIHGTEFQLQSGNTFSDKEWIDDTAEFKRKYEAMDNDRLEKGKKVRIHGLQRKKEWNGLTGTINDHYNFERERFPVHVEGNVNRTVLIKACNLQNT